MTQAAQVRVEAEVLSDAAPAAKPFPSIRRIWAVGAIATFVFDVLVATLLSVTGATQGGFFENQLYSHLIGTLILVGILGPRTLFWGNRRPPVAMAVLYTIGGTAFGLFGGRALAAWILGHGTSWTHFIHDSSFNISLLLSIAGALGATAYFWAREREAAFNLQLARNRERAEIASRQLTETQLRLLRAQVEPHMLFNTLSNLRALIPQDPRAAQGLLDHLIDFFRASLDASRNEWTSCEREFKLVADYLALMSVRLGQRLSFDLVLPRELARERIPSMLMQPLVENAIKHGIEPSMDGGRIRVEARRTAEALELTVFDSGTDNGPRGAGWPPQPDAETGSGFGNQQLRARLQTLYGAAASFSLERLEGQGTLARVQLPVAERPASGA